MIPRRSPLTRQETELSQKLDGAASMRREAEKRQREHHATWKRHMTKIKRLRQQHQKTMTLESLKRLCKAEQEYREWFDSERELGLC